MNGICNCFYERRTEMAKAFICDICGKVTEQRYPIQISVKGERRVLKMFDDMEFLSYDPGCRPIDFCQDCAKKIESLVQSIREGK